MIELPDGSFDETDGFIEMEKACPPGSLVRCESGIVVGAFDDEFDDGIPESYYGVGADKGDLCIYVGIEHREEDFSNVYLLCKEGMGKLSCAAAEFLGFFSVVSLPEA